MTKDLIKGLVVEALQEKKAVVNEGKISKSTLQQIIKEEYSRLVTEIDAGADNIPEKSPPPPIPMSGTGASGNIPPETQFREQYKNFQNALKSIWGLFDKGVPLKREVKKIIGLAQTIRQDTEDEQKEFIDILIREFGGMKNVLDILKAPQA